MARQLGSYLFGRGWASSASRLICRGDAAGHSLQPGDGEASFAQLSRLRQAIEIKLLGPSSRSH